VSVDHIFIARSDVLWSTPSAASSPASAPAPAPPPPHLPPHALPVARRATGHPSSTRPLRPHSSACPSRRRPPWYVAQPSSSCKSATPMSSPPPRSSPLTSRHRRQLPRLTLEIFHRATASASVGWLGNPAKLQTSPLHVTMCGGEEAPAGEAGLPRSPELYDFSDYATAAASNHVVSTRHPLPVDSMLPSLAPVAIWGIFRFGH
jgi:hypothetical protein